MTKQPLVLTAIASLTLASCSAKKDEAGFATGSDRVRVFPLIETTLLDGSTVSKADVAFESIKFTTAGNCADQSVSTLVEWTGPFTIDLLQGGTIQRPAGDAMLVAGHQICNIDFGLLPAPDSGSQDTSPGIALSVTVPERGNVLLTTREAWHISFKAQTDSSLGSSDKALALSLKATNWLNALQLGDWFELLDWQTAEISPSQHPFLYENFRTQLSSGTAAELLLGAKDSGDVTEFVTVSIEPETFATDQDSELCSDADVSVDLKCDGQQLIIDKTCRQSRLISSQALDCGLEPCRDGTDANPGCGNQCLLTNIDNIKTGSFHNCVTSSEGKSACWGADYGGLGRADLWGAQTNQIYPPAMADGITDSIMTMAPGFQFSCILTSAGQVKCLGSMETSVLFNDLQEIVGLESGVAAIASGWHHICALKNDGKVYCFGMNIDGALGRGEAPTVERPDALPVTLSGGAELTGVTQVTAGRDHSCALTDTSEVYCWGNVDGALHEEVGTIEEGHLFAVKMTNLTAPTQIAARYLYSCALDNDGNELKCWGTSFGPQPVLVKNMSGFRSIVAASYLCGHSAENNNQVRCLISSDGETLDVHFSDEITNYAAGNEICAVLKTDGVVQCLGVRGNFMQPGEMRLLDVACP